MANSVDITDGVQSGATSGSDDAGHLAWRNIRRSGLLAPLLVFCFAVWLHAATSMLAATTLPSAVAELGGASLIAWAFMLYQLGSILAGATAAMLVRWRSVRSGLVLAATVYGLSSAGCALAPGMEVILVGRLFQGVGGGMLVAITFIALNRTFPAHMIPRSQAIVSATWSASAFCGPLVGGSFATYGLWRFGFWAFVLQAAVFIACVLLVISDRKESSDEPAPALPIGRLTLIAAAILLVGLASMTVDATAAPLFCVASIVLIWLFLHIDRGASENRMFPRSAMNLMGTTGAGLALVLTASIGTMSFMVYGPILLETLYGVTPLAAGYIVALESVGWGIAAIFFSGVSTASERRLIRGGTALVSLGVVGFVLAMPSGFLWTVILCAFAQGAGFGMMWGYLVKHMTTAAPPSDLDRMSAALPTTQQVGFAVGAAAAGIVANGVGFADSVSLEAARAAAVWVFAAFVPLTLLSNLGAWRVTK